MVVDLENTDAKIVFESGYFDRENRKYIINNMTPTRPLVNYIWSEEFMMTLDHFGCGSSFGKVAYSTRRPLIGGEGSRLIYVKDRQSGQFFCANGLYTAKPHDFHEAHIVPIFPAGTTHSIEVWC